MTESTEIRKEGQDENSETIIKQHRRLTRWMDGSRTMGEGSLILTNRRLLFLHRLEASSKVATSIKNLADAPMEAVLDHALTLHKNCFQIKLSSIIKAETIFMMGFPLPRFYLSVYYLDGIKLTPGTVTFYFGKSRTEMLSRPQIIADWDWARAIRQAVKKSA